MTVEEFEREIFDVAIGSETCKVPIIRRLLPISINIRVPLTIGGFVDVYYNEETETTAYALIKENKRIFGSDNTGGWHIHPMNDPKQHKPLSSPMIFSGFIRLDFRQKIIEKL